MGEQQARSLKDMAQRQHVPLLRQQPPPCSTRRSTLPALGMPDDPRQHRRRLTFVIAAAATMCPTLVMQRFDENAANATHLDAPNNHASGAQQPSFSMQHRCVVPCYVAGIQGVRCCAAARLGHRITSETRRNAHRTPSWASPISEVKDDASERASGRRRAHRKRIGNPSLTAIGLVGTAPPDAIPMPFRRLHDVRQSQCG